MTCSVQNYYTSCTASWKHNTVTGVSLTEIAYSFTDSRPTYSSIYQSLQTEEIEYSIMPKLIYAKDRKMPENFATQTMIFCMERTFPALISVKHIMLTNTWFVPLYLQFSLLT